MNLKTFQAIKWSNNPTVWAVVDMGAAIKSGGTDEDMVVMKFHAADNAEKIANKMNDAFERATAGIKAEKGVSHDETHITLDEEAWKMLLQLQAAGRKAIKESPLMGMAELLYKATSEDGSKSYEDIVEEAFKEKLTPEAMVKDMIRHNYAKAVKGGLIKI
jgi:hypothetical protein